MNILFIGLGSIALKHIEAINKLYGYSCQILALRSSRESTNYEGVKSIYSLDEITIIPDFFIISNPTSHHYDTVVDLLRFKKPIFIEKPLMHNLNGLDDLVAEVNGKEIKTYVACNLRFHSCNQFIKNGLNTRKWGKIEEVNVYSGSYLPDWRKKIKDFRKCYSAIVEMGGGVHLDLIHEIDYIYWFFGKPKKINRFFKSDSSLAISSVDYAHYFLEYEGFAAQITLNYFRKTPKRGFELVTEFGVIDVDLLKGRVTYKDEIIFKAEDNEIINTYEKQMKYFVTNVVDKRHYEESMNQIDEAATVLRMSLIS